MFYFRLLFLFPDEAPKASPDHTTEVELELKSQSEVDAFTERITEV